MTTFNQLNIAPGRGICYSGFRQGQRPGGEYPSYAEIREDLLLLQGHWTYLRLFDVDAHSQTVLEVIRQEGLDFQVMLSAYINAEANNPNCPWGGGVHPSAQLKANRKENQIKIQRLIEWANLYPDIVFSLSVGNEACVDWTDHLVPPDSVLDYVLKVQRKTRQPVTFCENYAPWAYQLDTLAAAVDFISIHTYPVWEYKNIEEALEYTQRNYYAVADKYPGKPVVITEAGWATHSNGRGIDAWNVNEALQQIYFERLMDWVGQAGILTFFFEAFDEDWKGSDDPLEPEKHWGLFNIDRTPKLAFKSVNYPSAVCGS